jgi:hypothetical protein
MCECVCVWLSKSRVEALFGVGCEWWVEAMHCRVLLEKGGRQISRPFDARGVTPVLVVSW